MYCSLVRKEMKPSNIFSWQHWLSSHYHYETSKMNLLQFTFVDTIVHPSNVRYRHVVHTPMLRPLKHLQSTVDMLSIFNWSGSSFRLQIPFQFQMMTPESVPLPKMLLRFRNHWLNPTNLSEVQSISRKLTVTSFRFLHSAKLSTLQYNRISSFKLLIFSFRSTQGCSFISV